MVETYTGGQFDLLDPPEYGSWAGTHPDLGYDLDSGATDAVRDRFCSRAEALLDGV